MNNLTEEDIVLANQMRSMAVEKTLTFALNADHIRKINARLAEGPLKSRSSSMSDTPTLSQATSRASSPVEPKRKVQKLLKG